MVRGSGPKTETLGGTMRWPSRNYWDTVTPERGLFQLRRIQMPIDEER